MTDRVEVHLHDARGDRVVGELVDVGTGPHFEYAAEFLRDGVDLSPFTLARGPGVFTPGPPGLHRLRGLFFDAVPDGWGLKMLHQAMRDAGLQPHDTSAVAWLRALGTRGMGALTFHPPQNVTDGQGSTDLDTLAENAQAVDANEIEHVLPALAQKVLAGGSGWSAPVLVAGWRDDGSIVDAFAPLPKDYRPVLIKFASSQEPAGRDQGSRSASPDAGRACGSAELPDTACISLEVASRPSSSTGLTASATSACTCIRSRGFWRSISDTTSSTIELC